MARTQGDYTDSPNRLRIWRDAGNPEHPWTLDAVDTRDALPEHDRHAYTEQVWTLDTYSDAVAAIPEFVAQLSEYLPSVASPERNNR